MRLILAWRAVAHVRFAIVLLNVSLALGWLGESLWYVARGQMDKAAATVERSRLNRG